MSSKVRGGEQGIRSRMENKNKHSKSSDDAEVILMGLDHRSQSNTDVLFQYLSKCGEIPYHKTNIQI